nr:unnamed protein product [Spirometra erinaceieuropaei]
MKNMFVLYCIGLVIHAQWSLGCKGGKETKTPEAVECRDDFFDSAIRAFNTRLSSAAIYPKGYPVHVQFTKSTPSACCTTSTLHNVEEHDCSDVSLSVEFFVKHRKNMYDYSFVTESMAAASVLAKFWGILNRDSLENNCTVDFFVGVKLPEPVIQKVRLSTGVILSSELEDVLAESLSLLSKWMPISC